MAYVITGGDEGIQINEGTRLAIVGAGIKLPHISQIIALLKQVFSNEDLRIAASQENDWIKRQFNLDTFEQADATMQQQAEALADREGLIYAGFLPFADPKMLKGGIKGHMVRPKGMHLANKICFTLAGGEQTYNLGQYLVSADWLYLADQKLAQEAIRTQVEYYKDLAGQDLQLVVEKDGHLGEEIAEKNKEMLDKILEVGE